MDTTIGISIPKVPQLVPVAKAKNIATTNITTGRNELKPLAAFSIRPPTKLVDPRSSFEIFFKLVAIVKINIADTIDENPSDTESIDFSNDITFLTTKNIMDMIKATMEPIARAIDESVLAKAFTKS